MNQEDAMSRVVWQAVKDGVVIAEAPSISMVAALLHDRDLPVEWRRVIQEGKPR